MSDITVVNMPGPVISVLQPSVGLQGGRGPQGPPGPSGGTTTPFVQATASAVWTCPHNLGRYPGVTVTDGLGNVVTPDIQYIDDNIVRITNGSPIAGTVYFN